MVDERKGYEMMKEEGRIGGRKMRRRSRED
jgi:hypothetical protein